MLSTLAGAVVESTKGTPERTRWQPIVFPELRAVMQHLLDDGAENSHDEAVIGPQLRANFARQVLVSGGAQIPLTPIEARLLQLLYQHRGRIVAPETLLSQAWSGQGSLGSLWVHVRRLRNKLERNPGQPRYLITVRGQGYALQPAVSPAH